MCFNSLLPWFCASGTSGLNIFRVSQGKLKLMQKQQSLFISKNYSWDRLWADAKISLETLSREVRMRESGWEGGFMFIPSCTYMGFLSCKYQLGRHRPQAERDAPNPSRVCQAVCRAGHFAGVSQSGRVAHLKWRAGRQLRRWSTPTLHTKKAGLGAKIPPEAATATRLSSFAKPVSLCPASFHTPRLGCDAPRPLSNFSVL